MNETVIYYEGGEIIPGGLLATGHDIIAKETVYIAAHSYAKVKTGISLIIPAGYWVKIEGKSGLASKGIYPIGGIIDNDYTGEVAIVLVNSSGASITLQPGRKIAQFVVYCYHDAVFVKKEFDSDPVLQYKLKQKELTRGANGFGSTGDFK